MKVKKNSNGWTTVCSSAYLSSEVHIKERDGKFYVTTPDEKTIMHPLNLKKYIEMKDLQNRVYPEGITTYSLCGDSEDGCKNWIKNNCASNKDLRVSHKVLFELIKASNKMPAKHKEYEIVKDRISYEGNTHTQCEMIFKFCDKYYRFEYMFGSWGGWASPMIGKYNSGDNTISSKTYLCRNVQKKERTVVVTTYE
jgi:hypothetical protein